jgi:predicted transcriptional regulator
MQRTTVFLEESVRRDLKALARRQSRPAAALVREAILRLLEAEANQERSVPGFLGIGASGESQVAERHEDLVFRRLEPHAPARTARRRRTAGPAR